MSNSEKIKILKENIISVIKITMVVGLALMEKMDCQFKSTII